MAKGKEKKGAAKKTAPKRKTKKQEKEELRLKEIEIVHLDLCERDVELQRANIDLANARITNLTMDYHRKLEAQKQQLRDAQQKYEHLAVIRNRKLAEIEDRLKKIEPAFSFQDYLQQDDGTLVLAEDKVASLDPTLNDGGGTVSG